MITSLRSECMTSNYDWKPVGRKVLIAYADFGLYRQIASQICEHGIYLICVNPLFKHEYTAT